MELQKIQSVCPECDKRIDAVLYESNESVYMKKTCKEHGEFIEKLYDAELFKRIVVYLDKLHKFSPPTGVSNFDCSDKSFYKTDPLLSIIDVTNRCNLHCSYCFANADVRGYLYEPSYDIIIKMLKKLRNNYNPPVPSVMFSGGEPTIREDFLDIVRAAKQMNFFLLVATNGSTIAASEDYTKQLKNAGMDIVYLSFDGLTNLSNKEKRNHLIIDRILDHCRKVDLGIVLVPTTMRGLNDDEVYAIIKFSMENMDIIRGVSFQPISFCGRMSSRERARQRYTISDLVGDIEKQSSGSIRATDFYPIPSVLPLTKFVESLTGNKEVAFTIHPLCGSATYLFMDEDGSIIPINRFVDVERFITVLDEYSDKLSSADNVAKHFLVALFIKEIFKTVDLSKAPKYLSMQEILKEILVSKGDLNALGRFSQNSLFIGIMHFQDKYNIDFERVRYCGVHFMTPEMSSISFCAYNSLGYREKIENKYKKEWHPPHKNETLQEEQQEVS